MTGVGPPTDHGVFSPAPLGPMTLRNRVVKAATFEGMTRNGTRCVFVPEE